MTNAELLEKIKAEIERRTDKHWEGLPNADAPEDDWTHNELCELGAYKELEHLETFLDTLESEKPMNQEGLEEKISRTYHDGSVTDTSDLDHVSYENIARHFYELGCRRTAEKYDEIEYNRQRAEESPLPEDTVLFNKGVAEGKRLMMEEAVNERWDELQTNFREINEAFEAGKKEQMEQMLKDGNVILTEEDFEAKKEKSMEWGYNLCKEQMMKEAVECMVTTNLANRPVIYLDQLKGFEYGDKVKIIIVKEDEK